MDILEDVMAHDDVTALPELEFVIRLVLEELIVNVSNYAYGVDGDGPLRITLDRTSSRLTITLEDEGIPFNPLEHEDPDITQSIAERPIGGLGILLVKQMMDEVSYVYEHGCNRLVVVKHLDAGPACDD